MSSTFTIHTGSEPSPKLTETLTLLPFLISMPMLVGYPVSTGVMFLTNPKPSIGAATEILKLRMASEKKFFATKKTQNSPLVVYMCEVVRFVVFWTVELSPKSHEYLKYKYDYHHTYFLNSLKNTTRQTGWKFRKKMTLAPLTSDRRSTFYNKQPERRLLSFPVGDGWTFHLKTS